MRIDYNRVIFYISKLTKSSMPNFYQKSLEWLAYPSEKAICVIRIIKLYLDKTANLRNKNRYSFFVSYVASYAPLTPKTIVRWVLETLGKAGIASTGYNKGDSLTQIDKAAGWSNFATFAKFYNKPVDVKSFGLRI